MWREGGSGKGEITALVGGDAVGAPREQERREEERHSCARSSADRNEVQPPVGPRTLITLIRIIFVYVFVFVFAVAEVAELPRIRIFRPPGERRRVYPAHPKKSLYPYSGTFIIFIRRNQQRCTSMRIHTSSSGIKRLLSNFNLVDSARIPARKGEARKRPDVLCKSPQRFSQTHSARR